MDSTLTQIVTRVLRKLQIERLLKGTAVLLVALLIGSLFSTYVLARHNFSDNAVLWTRLVGITGLLFFFVYYVFWPLWRAPSKTQIARFLEERHPELEERLSTAVEIETHRGKVDPEIRQLIAQDARKKLLKVPRPSFYYPQRSVVSLLTLISSLLVFGLLFLQGPDVFPYSLSKLLTGWYDDSQTPLYSIGVTPGSLTVGKRSDLEIRAQLLGFDSDNVQLIARYENEPQWEETEMRPDLQGGDFVFIFFDIRDPIDYYVAADGIQSEIFRVQVSEIPRVERMEIVLKFPRYAGLPNVVQEDEGDLRALEGTVAQFSIRTDQPVKAGQIKLEDGAEIALELVNSGN